MYIEDLEVKDAKIRFTNFSGKERQWNPKGTRNFCLDLEDEDMYERMKAEGWNVKRGGEEGHEYFYLPVAVRFEKIPPRILLVDSDTDNKVKITEKMVSFLDDIDLDRIDVVVHPRIWSGGVKAYLRRMKAWAPGDEFEYVVS